MPSKEVVMASVNGDFEVEGVCSNDFYIRENEAKRETVWNGRFVSSKWVSFDSFGGKFFSCGKKESDTEQSVDYNIHAGTEKNGDTHVGGSLDYSVKTETNSGVTYSGSVGGYGEVDNHGKASGGVEVGGSVKW